MFPQNPNNWGVRSPLEQEMTQGMMQEIEQAHAQDDLVAEASKAERRRFMRIEFVKAILYLVGGIAALILILIIVGLLYHPNY
jgi:hypothetical protein